MRAYFTNQHKFLISGIRVSCKGKWSKTATGRAQKLVLTLGKLNTQTIDTFIDYSFSTVATKFGACSVKVLISYKSHSNRF
jgi:ribosomal protein S3